ncbi:MAG: VOC family protein [Anaerolineae bacterium]
MGRVVHFELAVDDPERAAQFYRDALGWEVQRWGSEDYWLIHTGPKERDGIDGALQRRGDAVGNVVNTVAVEDLAATCAKIVAAGGNMLTEKMVIPGVGALTYCQDTEGNPFCVLEPEPGMG